MADIGNPNDPNQLRTWALDFARQASGYGLYDNMSDYSKMLNPYFQQAQSSLGSRFNTQLNSQVGQAQNQAGAYAAFKGLNPASMIQNAGQGVRQNMTPSFTSSMADLLNNQNQSLLGATSQGNQFKSNNAYQTAQMMLQGANQAQESWDRPGFWDYVGGALGGGLGFLLGGPAGAALGYGVGNGISRS